MFKLNLILMASFIGTFMYIFNPVFMILMLTLVSIFMSSMIWMHSSHIWISLVILMIFLGGILIMFLMICSIYPNEKVKSSKNMIFLFCLMFYVFMMKVNTPMNFSMSMKWISINGSVMVFFVFLMMLYFFSIMLILKNFKTSMKTLINF